MSTVIVENNNKKGFSHHLESLVVPALHLCQWADEFLYFEAEQAAGGG
jgi:hypothetical protein